MGVVIFLLVILSALFSAMETAFSFANKIRIQQNAEDGNRKATEHPLYRLIHDEPNSEMTSFVLREVMLAHLLLWGNSYCQIIRTGRNKITGLYPLLPDKMTVDRDKNGTQVYTLCYRTR